MYMVCSRQQQLLSTAFGRCHCFIVFCVFFHSQESRLFSRCPAKRWLSVVMVASDISATYKFGSRSWASIDESHKLNITHLLHLDAYRWRITCNIRMPHVQQKSANFKNKIYKKAEEDTRTYGDMPVFPHFLCKRQRYSKRKCGQTSDSLVMYAKLETELIVGGCPSLNLYSAPISSPICISRDDPAPLARCWLIPGPIPLIPTLFT